MAIKRVAIKQLEIREGGTKRVEIKHREIKEGPTKVVEIKLGGIKVAGISPLQAEVAGISPLQAEVVAISPLQAEVVERSVGLPLHQQKNLGQCKFSTWMSKKWWIRLR